MVCIRLNNAGKYYDITLKIMIMLQNIVQKLRTDFGRREEPSAPYVWYLVKKWKKLASSSINQSVKSRNTMRTPENIDAEAESVCERHQRQFTAALNNRIFRKHYWDELCVKITQCVFTSLSGPVIDLQKMAILAKKIFFRWSSFWYWRVCKQLKLTHLGHRKAARSHWKDELMFGANFGPEA